MLAAPSLLARRWAPKIEYLGVSRGSPGERRGRLRGPSSLGRGHTENRGALAANDQGRARRSHGQSPSHWDHTRLQNNLSTFQSNKLKFPKKKKNRCVFIKNLEPEIDLKIGNILQSIINKSWKHWRNENSSKTSGDSFHLWLVETFRAVPYADRTESIAITRDFRTIRLLSSQTHLISPKM